MNHFAHALPHLEQPVMMIGTCLPDWLSAADRKCRVRGKHAREFVDHPDTFVAEIARGIVRHHHDDDWFHRTPAFNRLQMQFSLQLRELLEDEAGLRPGFLGHILVEILLDSHLIQRFPNGMSTHYSQVRAVDWNRVEWAVNMMASRPTDRIARFLARYSEAEYLADYQQDGRLLYRLNQIMMRVKLPSLDDRLLDWLPHARDVVGRHVDQLLNRYTISLAPGT